MPSTLYLNLRVFLFGSLVILLARALLSASEVPLRPRALKARLWAAALILGFVGLSATAVFRNSETMDEVDHMNYGLRILESGDTSKVPADVYDSKMPVSALQALPAYLARRMGRGDGTVHVMGEELPFWLLGRFATMSFSVLLLCFVFRWSRELHGDRGALLSLFLCVFCPNLLAHGSLITTDMPLTSLAYASTYYLWRAMKEDSGGALFKCALFFGAAQLSKYTAAFFVPIFCLIWWAARTLVPGERCRAQKAFDGFVCVMLVLLILNMGYLFERSFTPINEFRFDSSLFQGLQRLMSGLNPRVPLPYWYVRGFDMVRVAERIEPGHGLYLLGKLQDGATKTGFWDYYLAGFLLKTPTASLVLIAMCFWRWRKRSFPVSWDDVFLLVPPAFLFLYLDLAFRWQIGFRLFLPALPFLYTYAGQLGSGEGVGARRLAVLCLWLAFSTLSYFPYFIPYFNESIGDRKNAYLYMSDSNLQWSQGRSQVNRWLKENPGVALDPEKRIEGRLLVGANMLTGELQPERYRWLREHYTPIKQVAYEYLYFDTTKPPDR